MSWLDFPIPIPPALQFLFHHATWLDYQQAIQDAESDGRRVFITFDNGRMEIMTVSFRHEESKELLSQIVRILAD